MSPASASRSRAHTGRRRSVSGWRVVAVYLGVSSLMILGIAVSGVLAATAPPPPAASARTSVTEAGRGEELFLTSCAACHGPQGAGTENGPDIRSAGAALADFELRTGRMPLGDQGPPARRGTPQFDDADIAALVAYVASLGSGPAIPNVVVSGADLNAGRRLYVANCSACHGPAAGGGSVGGGFVAPALTGADATTVGEAVVTGPGPMPRFSFAPDDLDNLAAYVQFLHDPPHPGGATAPAVGPVTEGFVAALALLGLVLVARWVAVRREREVSS